MAQAGSAHRRQQGLQQAASVVFALTGIVPLLVFAFTLWHVGAIQRSFAQASLILTLVLMLLGYWMFRSMLARMSEIVSALSRLTEQASRARVAAARAAATPRPAVPAPATIPTAAVAAAPPSSVHDRPMPGLGGIREIDDIARTMHFLWRREARAHVGSLVQILVANAQELTGKLVEASDDGVLLEQPDGKTMAIAYRRVRSIEPLAGG